MIGKPITASSVGLSPEIVVTAPALSTIDILKNSVIVQTYTLTGAETQHTFYVPTGTYVARGTLDTKTQDKTIAVDTVASYSVEIDYKLWLYKDGNEYTALTGRFVSNAIAYVRSTSAVSPTITRNSSTLVASLPSQDACGGVIKFSNEINLSNYSTVHFKGKITIALTSTGYCRFCVWSSFGQYWGVNIVANIVAPTTGTDVAVDGYANISSLVGNYIVGFGLYKESLRQGNKITVERIWLEQ